MGHIKDRNKSNFLQSQTGAERWVHRDVYHVFLLSFRVFLLLWFSVRWKRPWRPQPLNHWVISYYLYFLMKYDQPRISYSSRYTIKPLTSGQLAAIKHKYIYIYIFTVRIISWTKLYIPQLLTYTCFSFLILHTLDLTNLSCTCRQLAGFFLASKISVFPWPRYHLRRTGTLPCRTSPVDFPRRRCFVGASKY